MSYGYLAIVNLQIGQYVKVYFQSKGDTGWAGKNTAKNYDKDAEKKEVERDRKDCLP